MQCYTCNFFRGSKAVTPYTVTPISRIDYESHRKVACGLSDELQSPVIFEECGLYEQWELASYYGKINYE